MIIGTLDHLRKSQRLPLRLSRWPPWHQRRMSERKIDNLTGIRGIAALWVALYHFQTTPGVDSLSLGSVVAHGYWGVDVFFVLSGLILAITYVPRFAVTGVTASAMFDFLAKRVARIYPLHIASFLVLFAAWFVASLNNYDFQGASINNWWSATCNLLMIHAWGLTDALSWNTPSWSISAEWFAYLLIFPTCIALLSRVSTSSCVVIAGALWLALVVYVYLRHDGHLAGVTTDGAVRIVPEFLGGYAAWRVIAGARRFPDGNFVTVAALLAIIVLCSLPEQAFALLLPSIAILLIGLYIGGIQVNRVFGNRAVVFLGEISYSIYMSHVIVQIVVNQIVRRAIREPSLAISIAVLMAEMVLTILCGYLGYALVEAPARKWIVGKLVSPTGR